MGPGLAGANGGFLRYASAFLLLDELDFALYWTSAHFARGWHVLEVEEGGWLDEESQLQEHVNPRREMAYRRWECMRQCLWFHGPSNREGLMETRC
ncbi:hypothetical protein VAPA_2c10020 [Variovorax paradoxus B4]|uniref:Uncharacterized protein n=1 Tax=Variovorax paradoxus B4 TaxID=1246301 RepID=T1XLS8_VARPD|nr:hypothetical protein VAPA_2c10020 [Variovorax paradoxus B4]